MVSVMESFAQEATCPLCHSTAAVEKVDGGQLTLCKAVACGPSIVTSSARTLLADRYSHVNIRLQQQAAQAGPSNILSIYQVSVTDPNRMPGFEVGIRTELVPAEKLK